MAMMFGSDVQKQFFLKQIKDCGYVDKGNNVISEFYTPLVSKEHDFLKNTTCSYINEQVVASIMWILYNYSNRIFEINKK